MDMLSGLSDLLASPEERTRAQDFTKRFDQGDPWDGISDDEALTQYRRVAPRLSTDTYRDSAQEALSRLSPAQRRQFGQLLAQQARERRLALDGLDGDDALEDPRRLGSATAQLQEQQPGMLESILSGSGAGSGQQGGLLQSPIAKAALAGIAAMAMKKVMGGR